MKNVLLFLAAVLIPLLAVIFCAGWISKHRPSFGTMQPGFVLLTALASAFVFVNYLNPFKRVKPFNCVTCLTGWIALALAFCFNVPFYCAYLFIGVLVGGLFERLKMRYL